MKSSLATILLRYKFKFFVLLNEIQYSLLGRSAFFIAGFTLLSLLDFWVLKYSFADFVIFVFQVLPVMIMGAFIPGLRRKYPAHEYISAVLLVVGLILFTLADAHSSPNFSVIGVIMVSGALVMDSFLGNLQEAIFTMNPETTQVNFMSLSFLSGYLNRDKRHSHGKVVNMSHLSLYLSAQTEMLFCSTLMGLPFLIPPMIFTGELFRAWASCSKVTVEEAAFFSPPDCVVHVLKEPVDFHAAPVRLWRVGV